MSIPSVGRIVHYVSHGTPVKPDGGQAYTSQCRAAVVTQVWPGSEDNQVGLCVLNPTGLFFHPNLPYHDGHGAPADPECPEPHDSGPLRYCPCGWTEPTYPGGTWHWPEKV